MGNPFEVQKLAQQQGISVQAIYEMDVNAQTKFIETMPDNPKFYIRRGNDYYELQNYEAAIQDFMKAINLNSEIPESYHYLADCYINLNKNKEAIEYYTKASEFSEYKSLISVYQRRAIAKKNICDYKGALDDINNSIKIDPNGYSEFYKLRSEIYYNLNELEKANDDIEKYETMKIESFKTMLSSIPNKEKINFLINIFSSLNDEEQNELLATLLFEYQDKIK